MGDCTGVGLQRNARRRTNSKRLVDEEEKERRRDEPSRVEPRNISAALVIFIVRRTGCRELLACKVIVFDAVILQCRACTHAFPPRATDTSRRSVVITAVLFLLLDDWRQSVVVGSFFDVTQRSATAIRCSETICQVARESLPSRRPGTPRAVSTSCLTFPRKSLAPSARYPPPCSPPLAHDARAVTRTSVRAFSPLCAPRSLLSALYSIPTRCLDTMRDLSKLCDLIRDGRITTSASRRGKSRWIVRVTGRWTRGSLNRGEEEEETATGHGGWKREGENGRGLETTRRDAKKRSGGRGREERSAVVPVAGEAAPPEGRKAVRVALVSLDRTFGSLPFVPVVHTRSRIRAHAYA